MKETFLKWKERELSVYYMWSYVKNDQTDTISCLTGKLQDANRILLNNLVTDTKSYELLTSVLYKYLTIALKFDFDLVHSLK